MTDPTHPFFGLTFPLRGITAKQRLGRVCVVTLYPGVERVIPIGATSLEVAAVVPVRCRLSLAGIRDLLRVVASVAELSQEAIDARLEPRGDRRTPTAFTHVPNRTGTTCSTPDVCDAPLGPGLERVDTPPPDPSTPDRAARPPGGTR